MQTYTRNFSIAVIIAFTLAIGSAAQPGQNSQQPAKKKASTEANKPEQINEQTDEQTSQDAIKLAATLITVPVVASDRKGLYIPDIKQEELAVYEDGVKQEITFFATVTEPFHVVLMLDTSASNAVEKMRQVQRAAIAFIEQLRPADRAKIISFDDEVRVLADFTSDRNALQRGIAGMRAGRGTRLYDAVREALASLRRVDGRKAIVLFTDGVDYYSHIASYEDTLKELEESGVIVYPIRYDTRAETEELIRQQGRLPGDPSAIPGRPPLGTTPPTMPGGESVPGGGKTGDGKDPWALPIPPIITRRPRTNRMPDDSVPNTGAPRFPYPDSRDTRTGRPDRSDPTPPVGRRDSSPSVLLEGLYKIADDYLNDLSARSGGKLHRADTLKSLPAAFGQIAAELRTQYSLGYYPSNAERDSKYHKIEVQTTRKDVIIRARPGYRSPGSA